MLLTGDNMGKFSKEKGKRFERLIASRFREYGYEARRGVQYQGSPDSPDIIGVPHIHAECKAVERLSITDAYDQAKRDAPPHKLPVVFHKRNNCPILVTMEFEDWMELYREYDASLVLDSVGERKG